MKDYYKILEVRINASQIEIKKSYRKLAFRYHPDKNSASNAAKIFIEITEAYETLIDPIKKVEYDKLYNEIFLNQKINIYKEQEYQEQQKEWSEYGAKKAKEYSDLNFDEFIKRAFTEVKLGANYLPNIITIGIVIIAIIGLVGVLPSAFDEGGGLGIFLLLSLFGLIYLVYHLSKVMSRDYSKERKYKNL